MIRRDGIVAELQQLLGSNLEIVSLILIFIAVFVATFAVVAAFTRRTGINQRLSGQTRAIGRRL